MAFAPRRGVIQSRAMRCCITLALLLSACAHGEPARTEPVEASPEASPAATPEGPDEPAQAPPSDGPQSDGTQTASDDGETVTDPPLERSVDSYMAEHFAVATWARDAVINGNLKAMRDPLMELARYEYASVVPGGWLPRVAQMQQAARVTAQARTLDLAATGVATMARVCGECHAEHDGGPRFATGFRTGKQAEHDTLAARMYRHMWAADRMWEGLTGPSDEAWRAGAEALAKAPLERPEAEPPLPDGFANALSDLRDLGVAATEADTIAQRADVYGMFLASCADCHAYEVQLVF
jgi:mono/diheme cytochrome c family protein